MEAKAGNSPESLRGRSTPELMDALREARNIESELQARGRAFLRNVLSKVEGFPVKELGKCTVSVVLDPDGAIVIGIPVSGILGWGSFDQDATLRRGLALKLRDVPGVAKAKMRDDSLAFLDVTLRLDQIPAAVEGSSPAVDKVRGSVGEDLRRIA